MKVLVTGASGFVGREVVRQLRAQGHEVRALVRTPISAGAGALARTEGVELCFGDILDAAAVRSAASGVEGLIHLVGIIREYGVQTFENMHVRATEHVVQAAQHAGVKRIVQVSALGTRPGAPSRYHRTKWQAEECVRQSGLSWTIFRPSLIYGPGDQFINLFERISRCTPVLFLVGRRESRFQPVFIEIVGRCVAGALTRAEAVGQVLDVCGPERLTLEQMLRTLMEVLGRRRWLVPMPSGPAWVMAALLEKAFPAVLRRPAPLNRDQLLMLQEDNVGDPGPFEQMFGLRQPAFREGLATWLGPAARARAG